MIRFKRFSSRPADWDSIIRQFAAKTIFHESAWHDHLQSIHPDGKMVYYEIMDAKRRVGLYCAQRVRRMLVPIHGSPLGGTGTNFMGPLIGDGVDPAEVLRALTRLFGPFTFLHVELANPTLSPEVMRSAGFNVQEGVTHLCRIPDSTEQAWATLRSEARNRIRKSEKLGVVVERVSDPAIVDHFHEQFGEVYGKQGMVRPFGRERTQSLWAHLNPTGRLLPLWARHEGEVLAVGLFPFDERCIYFWGATSWLRFQHLSPNEALHWGVIKFAAENGIPLYNMCGGMSQFKNKFGGEDVQNNTYFKSAIPLLSRARELYRDRHFQRLRKAPAVAESA